MPISHTANFGIMELHRSKGVIVHKLIDTWTSRLVMHYNGVMKLQWCKINWRISVLSRPKILLHPLPITFNVVGVYMGISWVYIMFDICNVQLFRWGEMVLIVLNTPSILWHHTDIGTCFFSFCVKKYKVFNITLQFKVFIDGKYFTLWPVLYLSNLALYL